MSVVLARTAGFCMGVKRAVDLVLDMTRHKGTEPIYTYGPLIHNPQTVELLRKRGIIPVSGLEGIASCRPGATLVVRAHGISPQERKAIRDKGLKIIDATCPKVGHVQAIIRKHASRDYAILIIGDEKHPEVSGLLGYAYGRGMAINSPEDVGRLPELEKVCVVAQTTQNTDIFMNLVAAVKARFPDTVVFNTICDSTEKRQSEIKHMAEEAEAIVVVGGRNSANTMQLARLSELSGASTFHIETADELKNTAIDRFNRIGVTAGASTPNWIIDRVVDDISERQGRAHKPAVGPFQAWLWMIRTDVYSALGAGCLSLVSMALQELPVHFLSMLTTALYVYAMHTLNRFINREKTSILGSFREESYRRHSTLYTGSAAAALLVSLFCAFIIGPVPFVLLFLISLIGVLYNLNVLPEGWRFRSLKDLPGSKNISMALAWAAVAAALPRIEAGLSLTPGVIVAFLFTFALVFIRSALSDILDMQSDRFIGRETIPVLIGRKRTMELLKGIAGILFSFLILAFFAEWTSPLALILLICLFYIWICFKLCDRRAAFSAAVLEGLLETNYVIAGFGAAAWLLVTRWFG